jgi:hypothetical protein
MKDKKTDARVIKTKQRVETTFLKLLEEMPFEKITSTLISKGIFLCTLPRQI